MSFFSIKQKRLVDNSQTCTVSPEKLFVCDKWYVYKLYICYLKMWKRNWYRLSISFPYMYSKTDSVLKMKLVLKMLQTCINNRFM